MAGSNRHPDRAGDGYGYGTTNTTEHHYDLAESGLADLGRVGFDDAGRIVEVLVALTHATLAIAAILATEDNTADRRTTQKRPYRLIRAGGFLLPFGLDDESATVRWSNTPDRYGR
jgi:hypothetical protein